MELSEEEFEIIEAGYHCGRSVGEIQQAIYVTCNTCISKEAILDTLADIVRDIDYQQALKSL